MTFSTGISSLRAHQTALSVVGNNIANASTVGFRREEVLFVENPHIEIDGLSIGTGVSIGDIRQVGDATLEAAILDNASEGSMLSARLQSAKQIEALFMPGTGSLPERLEELFLNMERLSALPTDATLRSTIVQNASGLADEINRIANTLNKMISNTEDEIHATINEINASASKISSLNLQISEIENSGAQANGLRNQRDVLLKGLSELIDVQRGRDSNGNDTFSIGGGLFSLDSGLSNMQLIKNEDGILEVWKEGCDQPFHLTGGKLAGLLGQINEPGGIQSILDELGDFTGAIVQHLDMAHAIGIGIGGAFNSLVSGRPIESSTQSLASQEAIIPVTAGRLYISINDASTDESTLHALDIDPNTQSLTDVAAMISGLDHLSASVDSTGRIAINSDTGFTFDFTGNLQTRPDTVGITGTSEPTMAGRYTGRINDEMTYRFIGSGTVGVTEGLQVEVQDGNGLVVRLLDVGTDYEPGSEIVIGNGVLLSLSSGTVADGDTFSVTLAGQPDETGFLSALGLNTLFVGNDIRSIQVNPIILENPSRLATTTNEDPSDTFNLHRMLAVRDERILRDGTVTLEQFLNELVANAGQEVGELTRDVEGFEENNAFLEGQLNSVTGVDVNEELARMLQYQRGYQAAARYIAAIDQNLQELFNIIR